MNGELGDGKFAFSLIEIGVVIVIASIIAAATITSFKLIEVGKVTSIINELKSYENGLITFYQRYQCIAGDCSDQLVTENFSGTKINQFCLTDNANGGLNGPPPGVKGDGLIKTRQESSCAMWQLQRSGLILESLDLSKDLGSSDAQKRFIGVTGVNRPVSGYDKDTSYQIVSVGNDMLNRSFLPAESNMGALSANNFAGRLMIVMTASSTESTESSSDFSWPVYNSGPRSIASVGAKRARRIDVKMDTGIPYSGRLIGGRDNDDAANGTPGNEGCTLFSGAFDSSKVNSDATYNNNNDSKCIVALVLPQLN